MNGKKVGNQRSKEDLIDGLEGPKAWEKSWEPSAGQRGKILDTVVRANGVTQPKCQSENRVWRMLLVSIPRDIIWRSIWQITLGGAVLGLILSIIWPVLPGLSGVATGFVVGCFAGLVVGTFAGLYTGLLVSMFFGRPHQKAKIRLLAFFAMLLPLVSCVGLPLVLLIPEISYELRDAHAMYHTGPISFSLLVASLLIGIITAVVERSTLLRYIRLH